tara:strand:- start:922 stop:1323 length:402 start_codon:yes stop_codon:yes gene_type:complete
MKKIDHVGIAVNDLDYSENIFTKLLGVKSYKREIIEDQKVITSFFKVNNEKIELLASSENESPINKFLKKNGEGIHHIAFEVENIDSEILRLKNEGFKLISDILTIGADNKKIVFLHPKGTNGVLIELCQEIS